MLVALIIVAALAAILAVALWMTRKSMAEFRQLADGRETALVAERQQLTDANNDLQQQLKAAGSENDRVTKQRDDRTAQRDEALADGERTSAELDKARRVSDELEVRMARQATEIGSLVSENNGLQERVEIAEAAAAAVVARDSGIVIGDLDNVGSQPETLWDLEITRSERTWRNSVAINPADDTSPFEDADDPLRLAVEIEAAALRENVGAFITIDWRAGPVEDPARRHLIVRVAQELLEAAARCPEASRLVVDGDDDVSLRLEPTDDSDEVINIIPPRITSDLIDVRSETGINVTVKAE